MPSLARLFKREKPVPQLQISSGSPGLVTPTSSDVYVTENVWNDWNRNYQVTRMTVTGSTATNAATDVWRIWNNGHDSTTCGSNIWASTTNSCTEIHVVPNTVVWNTWNANWSPTQARVISFPHETEEQRAQRLREYEDRQRIVSAAKHRAQELLLQVLNEEQRRDWSASGQFYLHVGDRKYRIKRGRSGNVELVNSQNEVMERYCCHPTAQVPDEDTVLAQVMMLRHAERDFLKMANVHYTAPGFRRAA